MKKDYAKDSKKIAMNFWGRVELAQTEAGYDTIKDLCQEAGVVYQTVMNHRSAGTLPNLMTIIKISQHVRKSMDWLLFGDTSLDTSKKEVANAILNDPKAYDIARYVLSMPKEEKEATMLILKKVSSANSKKP